MATLLEIYAIEANVSAAWEALLAKVCRFILPFTLLIKVVVYVGVAVLYVPAGIIEKVWQWLEKRFKS
jgi:energy-converting hydrogenase Eha subunit F